MAGRFALALFAALLGACATGPQVCRKDPITGSERCQASSGNAGEAAGTVVGAAAAWGVVGCKVNGCEPPFRCNAGTKMCERTPCGEGQGSCPPAYHCDLDDNVCR
jgi:hypothetical protein